MTDEPDTDDPAATALERELRLVAQQIDPPSHLAMRVAKDSFTWRTVDAELAELVRDSLVDADGPTLVRDEDQPRQLTFGTGGYAVELEVTVVGEDRELLGQLVPPGPPSVAIRHRGGTARLDTDDLGCFGPVVISGGPVSLQFTAPDEVVVMTEWLAL